MSENNRDPLEGLQSFRTGGLAVNPLPATEVRRLGDKRRTRRRGAALVAAAAVLAAVAVPVAVLAGGGDKTGSPPIAGTPTATPTDPSGVITYPQPGIEVVTPADTAKLEGTTTDFKTFIGQVADQQAAAGASCPAAFHGVTVQKYSSAGYAIGGVNACGGYIAIWAEQDAGWQEVMGGQDAFDCAELRYYGIPKSFAGGCYEYKGDFGPDEVGGLHLGMTAAQIEAAGGRVVGNTSNGMCRSLVLPNLTAVKDRTDGWVSPQDELVMLAGRPGAKTPKKIGFGSSRADVEAAYPTGALSNGYWVVPLSSTVEYEFGIQQDGTVGEMLLTRSTQNCTN